MVDSKRYQNFRYSSDYSLYEFFKNYSLFKKAEAYYYNINYNEWDRIRREISVHKMDNYGCFPTFTGFRLEYYVNGEEIGRKLAQEIAKKRQVQVDRPQTSKPFQAGGGLSQKKN